VFSLPVILCRRSKPTIGFPSANGLSKKRRTLGQCWPRAASADGLNQIFLNPTLTSAERVVDVLAHELVHAVDDCKSGSSRRVLEYLQGNWLNRRHPRNGVGWAGIEGHHRGNLP